MSLRTLFGALLLVQATVATVYYSETFDASWESRWVQSTSKTDLGKFKLSAGKYFGDAEKDLGIQTSQDAKFYGISTKAPAPFDNLDKPLVIQFSVKHEQNIDCGGGYVKVMPAAFEPTEFNGDSEYFVMFGPDICGATKKIHLIFNYKGENLLWKKEPRCESDVHTHVYTAVIKPDGTYEVLVDNTVRESGSLEEDWAFLKPKTIPDPEDKKPADWVDEARIPDPEDKKPEDWDDQPETIADPEAEQPEDWDEEEDGAWEAPMIPNPDFKGEWKPKMIDNPAFKGVWKAQEIPNPDYVEDKNIGKYENIGALGFDLWQVKAGTIFDNIIITDSVEEAKDFYDKTTGATIAAEKEAFDKAEAEIRAKEEAEAAAREAEDGDEDEDEDDVEEDDDHDEL